MAPFLKRTVAVLFGGFAAAGGAILFATLADRLGIAPSFPVFAGEDDFTLRISYFLFIGLPGFLLLGAWIGWTSLTSPRQAAWMALGCTIGTVLAFAVPPALASQINTLSTRDAANRAVWMFFLAWVLCSAVGAMIGRRTSGLIRS